MSSDQSHASQSVKFAELKALVSTKPGIKAQMQVDFEAGLQRANVKLFVETEPPNSRFNDMASILKNWEMGIPTEN